MFAGSALTLDCVIQLSADIESDSEVVIIAVWKRNGTVVVDTTSQVISDVIQTGATYLSQLTFNPLELGLDDGVYTCTAMVDSLNGFVLGSMSQSNGISLHVAGKYVFVITQHLDSCYCMCTSVSLLKMTT